MKKLLTIVSLLLLTSLTFAQKADQMIGVSALQFARGGAIIASPVDAPSMIYNPAAIGMLDFDKIGFDLSLGVVNPPRKITSAVGTPMEKTTESGANSYMGMGNGFVVKVNDKLILGMAAGGVSGLGVDFPATTMPDNPMTPFPENVSFVSKKGLLKITPTIAYKVSDCLVLGASFQIGNQSLALKSPAFMLPQSERWGFGGSFGLIYKPLKNLQVGLSYTSEMAIAEYEFNGTSLLPLSPPPTSPATSVEGIYKMEMNSPQQFAFGIAFAPMPKLLLEADVKWINQSAVMDKIEVTSPTGSTIPLPFGWDDQMVYAISAEFQPGKCLKVIAGWSFGATPISEENVVYNLGSIAVVEHHISLGVNKSWNDNLSSTLSYTRGLHNSVESNTVPSAIIEAEFNMVYFQLSYRM
ncbi:MAG: long-chain fatty acid ABC transporter [Ignavibacteriae bacterium]|nr:long-chain fatty acid ABC transporter [Ignavibacteriota bacterium]